MTKLVLFWLIYNRYRVNLLTKIPSSIFLNLFYNFILRARTILHNYQVNTSLKLHVFFLLPVLVLLKDEEVVTKNYRLWEYKPSFVREFLGSTLIWPEQIPWITELSSWKFNFKSLALRARIITKFFQAHLIT